MKKIFNVLSLVATAIAVSACGGGGGSSGSVSAEYQIVLKTDPGKDQLPLNIDGKTPGFDGYSGFGVYSPFTTVLHLSATVGGGGPPIPNQGDSTFGCNLGAGLKDNALYYLDGKDEHMVEVDDGVGGKRKVPAAYRAITLPANAGGATFHFHAGNEAGVARIECSVTDPRDNSQKKAVANITIGGATGKPASVRVITGVPSYLGTKSNASGILNQMGMQAFILDDANQPTGSSSGPSMQVRILSGTDAAVGARLVSGSLSGSVLQVPTVGGVAQFSLLSGNETGPIFLEFTGDRYDNNVANGIQDPISTIDQVSVIQAYASAVTVPDVDLGDVTNAVQFTKVLTAQGGLPPYTWSASGLPNGLSVDAKTGLLSGTPNDVARDYLATVAVVDKNKAMASGVVKLKLVNGLPEDFAIGNCNSNAVCSIGSAPVGTNFAYSFVASTSNVNWTFTSLPAWLTSGTTSTAGVVNGTPKVLDCGNHRFFVTAKKGGTEITRTFSISVVSGRDPAGVDDTQFACP